MLACYCRFQLTVVGFGLIFQVSACYPGAQLTTVGVSLPLLGRAYDCPALGFGLLAIVGLVCQCTGRFELTIGGRSLLC